MKSLHVGELKSRFSDILEEVKHGEEVIIAFGKKKVPIAVIIPFKQYSASKRKLGLLKGKASFKLGSAFKISDKELFTL